jgi:hypothetical protein
VAACARTPRTGPGRSTERGELFQPAGGRILRSRAESWKFLAPIVMAVVFDALLATAKALLHERNYLSVRPRIVQESAFAWTALK